MFEFETVEPRKFEFAVNGERYSVPLMDGLPWALMESFAEVRQSEDGVKMTKWFIDNVFEAYAPGSTEELTVGQITELLTAYDAMCSTGE